jgi:hypothetical protein
MMRKQKGENNKQHPANMSSHMDPGTQSNKLNKPSLRNKAIANPRPAKKDNKFNKPPVKDHPKKRK